MNNSRRKEINILIAKLERAETKEDVQNCIDILEGIQIDEQYYFDNIPENLQSSERAYLSEEAIENMEEALSNLNDALTAEGENTEELIETAIVCLEDAQL